MFKFYRRVSVIATCALYLSACSAFNAREAQPALLISKDTRTHLEISSLISKSLGQTHLKLNTTMFRETSILALEQPDLTGRQLDLPIRFQLVKKGDRCYLVNMQNNERWQLTHAKCELKEAL